MGDLLSGGVDGLVSLPTDGVDKLSIAEDLVGEVDLSVVGMKDCLCVHVCVRVCARVCVRKLEKPYVKLHTKGVPWKSPTIVLHKKKACCT